MSTLVLRNVEVEGRRVDVACTGGKIATIAPCGTLRHRSDADAVLDGDGGALLPGLHDHHLHLLATDAAARSVAVGPEQVANAGEMRHTLRKADGGADGWIRAIGYHDSVAGPLDRWTLDALVDDRPVRVQHRSGAMWVLNSAACAAVGLDADPPIGAQRSPRGQPNGRLMRLDEWLRDRLPPHSPPHLAELALRLNSVGITGVTDATPVTTLREVELLGTATSVRVRATGGPNLTDATFPSGLVRGPVKVILDEHDLPALVDLVGWFTEAHRCGRAVAVHCVTRASLVLAVAAWDVAGAAPGDRVEHGSVIPAGLIPELARLRLTVVTQPAFVAERGDAYMREVDPDDVQDLYRCASLIAAGVAVAGSTDSPYTEPNPWTAIAAAVDRRTRSGKVIGDGERLTSRRALDLFLGALDNPGGPPRRVQVGAPGDLVLLSVDLAAALAAPSAELVAATVVDGQVTYQSRGLTDGQAPRCRRYGPGM